MTELSGRGKDQLVNAINDTESAVSSEIESSVLSSFQSKRRDSKILQLSSSGTWKEESTKKRKLNIQSSARLSAIYQIGRTPEFRFKLIVGLLFVFIVFLVWGSNFYYHRQKVFNSLNDRIYLWEQRKQFDLLNSNGNEILKTHFGLNIPDDIRPLKCFNVNKDGSHSQVCLDWKYRAHLNINFKHDEPNDISCYDVHWQSYDSSETVLKDCFSLEGAKWYGMGHVKEQSWPLNDLNIELAPFITGNNLSVDQPFGSIIERYWISSKGVSIRVPLHVPLFVSFNSTKTGKPDNSLCLEARTEGYPYDMTPNTLPHLDYQICSSGQNILSLHKLVSRNWTRGFLHHHHQSSAHSAFLENPIWSTGTKLMANLSQASIQNYADKILSYGFEPGFILIDSRWEEKIGDLHFDPTSFPDASSLLNILHNKGFKILLTVTPFIDISSTLFSRVAKDTKVIQDPHLNVPLLTQCFNKMCALIDMLNPSSREWMKKRLKDQVTNAFNVDGYFFDGVQVSLMPHHIHNTLHNILNPDYFQIYYKNIARHSSSLVGMNVGTGIQNLNGYFQIQKLNSTWDALQTIIPSVLTFGLIGYPVINPGSVGGDNILNETDFDKELYIRWLELSAFMPVLQFAEPPGKNDLEIIKVGKKLLKVRLALPMQKCLHENQEYGFPIIRPIWWLQPDDDAFQISDQFAIGDDIIVAPILKKGERQRDIFLPVGWWKDELNAQVIKGGKWIRNYQVDLDKVPYFNRTEPVNG